MSTLNEIKQRYNIHCTVPGISAVLEQFASRPTFDYDAFLDATLHMCHIWGWCPGSCVDMIGHGHHKLVLHKLLQTTYSDTPLTCDVLSTYPSDVVPAPLIRMAHDTMHCCPICLDAILPGTSVYQLSCGHVFHMDDHIDCHNGISRWLSQKGTCPVCRRSHINTS